MLDPANIFKTLQDASNIGKSSHSTLQKPFLDGVTQLDITSVNAVDTVINQVMQSNSQMLNNMNKIFHGLQQNVSDYQDMQSKEQPKDFDTVFDDLRPTKAYGVPFELHDFFTKLPKLK